MKREELNKWSNDYDNQQLSGGAFILYLKLYISDLESKTNDSDLTIAYMSGQADMEKKMLARTCESCEYASGIYFNGQLTNFRCKIRNEDQWSHVHEIDFGCNKWSSNDKSIKN